MLELLDLELSGIGRFVEKQTIDFASLQEFIQVDAINNNTKGSSGSGKTTVFNSLDYLLGLNDLPSTILQCRYTDDPITVSGKFLWDGKPVSISRGKKLKVTIGDKVVEGSSALAEEQIDKILGMPRKLFRKLLHKRQKEGGFFLDFTPAKMHEFLIDCLDLSEFRKYDAAEDLKIKNLTTKKITEESFLNGQIVGLDATKEAILSLGPPPKKETNQGAVLGLKKRLEEVESQLKSVEGFWSHAIMGLEPERPKTEVVPFDRLIWDDLVKIKTNQENLIFQILQEEKDRQAKVRQSLLNNKRAIQDASVATIAAYAARQETIKLAEEIKKIRASICPTCEQSWITEQYNTQERSRLTQILQLKNIVDAGEKANQDQETLNNEGMALEEQLKPIVDSRLPDINALIAEIAGKILAEKQKSDEWIAKQNAVNRELNEKFAQKEKELRDRCSAELNQARGQVDITRRVFDATVGMLKSSVEAAERYESNLKDLKSKEEKFTNKIAEVKATISATDADLALAEDTKKAIKQFLSYSFDDAIESIGTRATEIIRCIPNMSNATIQFDGTKETKDGKIKEEVNAVLAVDGEEDVPIKSLSGGERSALDIAVDLAVIDFIETKSGKGINLFILDEPFTGLGPVEIEMALEVLKNSNTNKKIVIVDHNSEVKQMVQNRLVVVRDGLTSRIEKSA